MGNIEHEFTPLSIPQRGKRTPIGEGVNHRLKT